MVKKNIRINANYQKIKWNEYNCYKLGKIITKNKKYMEKVDKIM